MTRLGKMISSLIPAACVMAAALALPLATGQAAAAPSADAPSWRDALLGEEIRRLFKDDQDFLIRLADARSQPAFAKGFADAEARFNGASPLRNFTSELVYASWARDGKAPLLVRQYVEFRKETDARVREIVERAGWPRRAAVGDLAAADFFFLFGHADALNAWRATQTGALEAVFRGDRVNARLYAHLSDRILDMSGQPQIYGTIMGPKGPGVADVYWPIKGERADVERRRAAIGLPAFQADLDAFRGGAEIGPYMSPIHPGEDLPASNVYARAQPYAATPKAAADG